MEKPFAPDYDRLKAELTVPPTITNTNRPEDYAPRRDRTKPTEDNVHRIAEFINRLTWREAVTISEGIKCEAQSMIEWAEKLVNE